MPAKSRILHTGPGAILSHPFGDRSLRLLPAFFSRRSLVLLYAAGCLISVLFLSGCTTGSPLVADGKSDYHIFVSEQASLPEKNAALELQHYLHRITGCRLPLTHQQLPGQSLIYVGFREAPAAVLNGLDTTGFGKEEFIIRSDGKHLLIAGGAPRGTVYGVVSYLTDHLGCRWYTREVIHIPARSAITLSRIEDRQQPAFEYREPYYREAYDTEWALHNRTNSRAIPDSLGGAVIAYPFVHTFYQLVPPETYFATHPEYFSEIGGVRVHREMGTQLCLTNPEVVKIATASVFDWIRTHPEASVYSVDQNDGGGYCECRNCKELDEREGSQSGTLLHFVNQIADTVAKVYPDVTLQTLAYYYTEVPPKTIRPADNVTIRLCHYDYCSAHPLGTCTSHTPYIERLEAWKKIAKRITIWDYYTQFASYLMPFPNLETVKNDVKFYADHGVVGLFAQGNNVPDDGRGEFTELRAWLFAQLMWNPYQDAQALVDEFVQNVYGASASYISDYIRMMHDQVRPDSVYFSIWTNPEDVDFLNLGVIQQADSLFALAKEAARNDTALFKRVERAYLPVLYTKLYFYAIGGTAYIPAGRLPGTLADFKRIITANRITSMAEVPETGSIPNFLERVQSADHFLTDWWLAGPFDNTGRKGLATVYEPELGFDSTATFKGMNGAQVTWSRYSDNTSGYINFFQLFNPKKDVVAYAFRKLYVPEARAVTFGVGSNDGVKVWINGKPVLDRLVSRKAVPNDDVITVSLQKGENTVLVKVDQLANKWGFYFTQRN